MVNASAAAHAPIRPVIEPAFGPAITGYT